ncbi:MAG: iron ABC transporter permease [Propionibacteriaceae bacterium]|nr:iron ABC transporter permease [Propionibacteriaceae bacterium]
MTGPVADGSVTATKASRYRRAVARWAALALVLWFLLTFLIAPNLYSFATVLNPQQGTFASLVSDLVTVPRVQRAVVNSLLIAILSVVTVNIVGITQALILEAIRVRGRTILTIAYAIPLVFGSVSAVTGYAMVYGSNGILTRALTTLFPALPADWFSGMAAIWFVHTFTMTGYHFLFLRPAIRRVDFSLVEAARSLGLSPMRAMLTVVVPILRPMILASVLMVFIGAANSFAAPNILGGTEFQMLAPLVQALTGLGRVDMSALLGLSMAAVTGTLLVWALREERRARVFGGSKAGRPFKRIEIRSPVVSVVIHVIAYTLAAINFTPVLITILLSLSTPEAIRRGQIDGQFSLANYIDVASNTGVAQPIVNSLVMSAIAIPLALIIGTFVAQLAHRTRNRATDALQLSLFLPYFLPGILIAVGMLITFGSPMPLVGNRVLVGGFWILPIAYVIVLLPTVARFMGAAYAGLDPALDEAGASLGARNLRRTLTITLPLLLPILMQVAALGFNATFDEYTLSVMLYNIHNRPLGVTLATLAASQDPNLVGTATAYVVINTFLSLGVILFADYMSRRVAQRQTAEVDR